MTLQDDMKARLFNELNGMIAPDGGNRDKPYLSTLQCQTLSSVITNKFFILDRNDLATPRVADNTGRANRYLHAYDHRAEGANIQGTDSWDLAVDKLVSAIHDIEALELARDWKENKDREDQELRDLAMRLFNLSNPTSEWSVLSDLVHEKWINIARNAKTLLT